MSFYKQVSVVLFLLFSLNSKADTYYTFRYKTKDQLKISVPANDFFEARTKAGKECFRILTKGEYQGEEESLNIIDMCANPEVK